MQDFAVVALRLSRFFFANPAAVLRALCGKKLSPQRSQRTAAKFAKKSKIESAAIL
jgi:hypothetical protein